MSFNQNTKINNLYQIIYPIIDIQDVSGSLLPDVSNNYNYSNNLVLQGLAYTYDTINLGSIPKPVDFTTTLPTNFYMKITGEANPGSLGFMEGGAWIKDVNGNTIAQLNIGNDRGISSGLFDISNNTVVANLSPSQFPLSVQEYVYYLGWAIYGNATTFTCNVVMTPDYPNYNTAYYSPSLNKFGYGPAITPTPSTASQVIITNDVADTTCFIPFVNSIPLGTAQSLKAQASLTYNAFTNQLGVPSLKPTTITDSTASVGLAGQVLSSTAGGLSWISPSTNLYGNGADGTINLISGTLTLTGDIYGSSITINAGTTLFTAGYRIFCSGTLTNNGTISNIGGNGANGTSGAGIGAAAGILGGGANGANGVGTGGGLSGGASNPTVVDCSGGTGGKIGTGGGGAGGLCTLVSTANGGVNVLSSYNQAILGRDLAGTLIKGGSGGGSGSSNGTGQSGSGGGGGGIILICAKTIVNNGTITVKGGTGGAGTTGGGGGGGGGAGTIVLITSSTSVGGTLDRSGGTAGTGGSPAPLAGASGRLITFYGL